MGPSPSYLPCLRQEVVTLRRRKAWCIYVRLDVEERRARYLASGELSRWWLRHYGSLKPTALVVSRLAAAALTPAPLFRAIVAERGNDPTELADLFGVPESLALLRLGEVCGVPVAVARPDRKVIMLRGDSHRWHGHTRHIQLADDNAVGLVCC